MKILMANMTQCIVAWTTSRNNNKFEIRTKKIRVSFKSAVAANILNGAAKVYDIQQNRRAHARILNISQNVVQHNNNNNKNATKTLTTPSTRSTVALKIQKNKEDAYTAVSFIPFLHLLSSIMLQLERTFETHL